jgi:tetratricopeptide (TPR) repeat protein
MSNPGPHDVRPPAPTPRRFIRWGIGLGAVVGLAFALGLIWFAFRERAVLPEIDTANAHPELVKVVKEASEAVRENPRSAETWGRLGMVLLAHDYYPQASECFIQAEKRDPKNALWLYFDAQACYRIYPDRAIGLLEKAVAVDELDATFRLLLGEILLEDGRLDDAERHLAHALKDEQHRPWGHLRLAQLSLRRGQVPQALDHAKLAEQGLRVSGDVKAAHVLLAEIYFRLGDEIAAGQEYQKALKLPTFNWPDPHMEKVERLKVEVLGQVNQAKRLSPPEEIARLEELVRANSQSVPAYISLAKAYEKQQMWDSVEAASSQALKLNPEDAIALNLLGLALSQQGKPAEAMDIFKRSVQRNPNNADTYVQLGFCYYQLKDKAAAKDALRHAVRLRANFGKAWLVLGQLYAEDNNPEALVCLRRALELSPDDATARKSLDDAQKRFSKSEPAPSK